eukprot:gnl/TRDRNA2_/TRDRNA2_32229_c0_seq1.p1 gnl/TRDRNA2_/TRDRNA2_32229_c0~~gnl/TRDRNA2_/TRDRNA2_32229_c0_seq1.p1  ORF type:complete len:369 (-),score=43.10 gnl/TRDRNA2_/TRDRNA2_32229_c0_seq1:15-995(-)
MSNFMSNFSCCATHPHANVQGMRERCSVALATLVEEPLCTRNEYVPSLLEADFASNTLALTASKDVLCNRLDVDTREAWIGQIRGCERFSESIFSKICRKGESPQLVEPLAGLLRDPRMTCAEQPMTVCVDWLLFADAESAYAGQGKLGRRRFFDAGGSRFVEAMSFFATEYSTRGIDLDEIHVWEKQKQGIEKYWEDVPPWVREKYESRVVLHDGVPVTVEPHNATEVGNEHNPVSLIHRLCRPHDFCAFKLDINVPWLELALVRQLLREPNKTRAALDEFFWEHHVHGMMQNFGWKHYVRGTYAHSYNLFAGLRRLGVRAHSWI